MYARLNAGSQSKGTKDGEEDGRSRDPRSWPTFGVFQERSAKVAWRFSAKAAPDAREFNFHPTQRLIEQPDGSLVVELEAGGLLEMCWHLVTWGSDVEILRPKRLQRLMEDLRKEGVK